MELLGGDRSGRAPWKTVVVEGQTLLRELLAKELEADGRFVVLAQLADPEQARELCRSNWPDLLLVEVDLPRPGGLELIAHIVRVLPGTRVLVLSQRPETWMVNRLSEIGIHGFVEKDQSAEIMLEAAVEVASGRTYFTAAFCRMQEQLRSKVRSHALTPSEREVLRLLARGLTSRAIAQQLALSPRSVETYRYRMMRKLGVVRTAGLIKFALQQPGELVGSN